MSPWIVSLLNFIESNKDSKEIILDDENCIDDFCAICYEDFDDIKNIKEIFSSALS